MVLCKIDYMVIIYTKHYVFHSLASFFSFSFKTRFVGEASKRKTLDWPTRLSIMLGAAKGKYHRLRSVDKHIIYFPLCYL